MVAVPTTNTRVLILAHQSFQKGLWYASNSTHLLEPNTYECPIRTIRTYWAEILIFDKKMRCSAQYVRMAMTLKILQVLIILPLKIYKFTKDNSTHGNCVQGQLDPRQFRPRTTRQTAISSKDNSTHGNFVQGQLDPR